MTAKKYIEVLKNNLLPFINNLEGKNSYVF